MCMERVKMSEKGEKWKPTKLNSLFSQAKVYQGWGAAVFLNQFWWGFNPFPPFFLHFHPFRYAVNFFYGIIWEFSPNIVPPFPPPPLWSVSLIWEIVSTDSRTFTEGNFSTSVSSSSAFLNISLLEMLIAFGTAYLRGLPPPTRMSNTNTKRW